MASCKDIKNYDKIDWLEQIIYPSNFNIKNTVILIYLFHVKIYDFVSSDYIRYIYSIHIHRLSSLKVNPTNITNERREF